MTFQEWCTTASTPEAAQFRSRMKHGESGNPENPWIAAELAYEAGRLAGVNDACDRMVEFLKGNK